MLDCVTNQIKYFQSSEADDISKAIAELVLQMLSVEANERPPAVELYHSCKWIQDHIMVSGNKTTPRLEHIAATNSFRASRPKSASSFSYSSEQPPRFDNYARGHSSSLGSSTKPKIKTLPYAKARVWLDKLKAAPWYQKTKFFQKSELKINHCDQLHQVVGRDHVRPLLNRTFYPSNMLKVFLSNNSESMSDYWADVREEVDLLSNIIFHCKADNRIDIRLAMGDGTSNSSSADHLVQFVRSKSPGVGIHGAEASIQHVLEKVLQGWIKSTEQKRSSRGWRSEKKPLSLYVLTTGNFPAGDDVELPIRQAIEDMKHIGLQHDHIGIQFVRFGDDPTGIARLNKLDNLEEGQWDIVDTEPWNGDVLKIFLGPINRTYDQDPSSAL